MVVKWAGLSLLITLVSRGVPDVQLKMPSIKKKKSHDPFSLLLILSV